MKNPAAVALGSMKSKAKASSSKKNGIERPHLKKVAHFEKIYPHELQNNEWKVKFPLKRLTKRGRPTTYNPDYFCPKTGFYIEVATSKPNISEQGERWAECIKLGNKLKVFWWEGEEITSRFTGRPKAFKESPLR